VKVYTAKAAHDAWRAGGLAILDVREEDEHEATRIPDVPLIPMSELLERIDEVPADCPLAIVCRSGARSAHVAEYLTEQGEHGEVANLEGGIIAWAAEGLPYEGEPPR
jgi:rhodanese-related sulfurtransferase